MPIFTLRCIDFVFHKIQMVEETNEKKNVDEENIHWNATKAAKQEFNYTKVYEKKNGWQNSSHRNSSASKSRFMPLSLLFIATIFFFCWI